MKRKFLSTTLVATLSLSMLLAGCGGNNGNNGAASEATNAPQTAEPTTAAETPKEVVALKAFSLAINQPASTMYSRPSMRS